MIKQFFSNLIDPKWIFNVRSISEGNELVVLLVIFGVFILLSIVFWIILARAAKIKAPYYQELKDKLFTNFLTYGIIGLLLVFFKFESIPYLSMPFWLILLFIIFIIWLVVVLIYYFKKFTKKVQKYERDQEFKKYLPQERKKK